MQKLPPAAAPAQHGLRADHSEETVYLKNIVHLLAQSKRLASHARQQARGAQRKVFNYSAFEVDIDTVIFAIKRYIAADDYTPRRFQSTPPAPLGAQYLHVE